MDIDPKEVLAASEAFQKLGAQSSSSLSESFMKGINKMNPASSQNASAIIGNIQDVGETMLKQIGSIKSSMEDQLFAHQDKQRRAKPYDFHSKMDPTTPVPSSEVTGRPKELNEFFDVFMKKGG